MKEKEFSVPVFRSADPDAVARGVVLLESAGIRFREHYGFETCLYVPRRIHYISVRPQDVGAAREALSSVPSEIILFRKSRPLTKKELLYANLSFLAVVAVFVYIFIRMILNEGV